MDQKFASPAVINFPQQRPTINGSTVLKAILHLQKLNGCSVNNLKKYLASQHGVDYQVLDTAIKPIMKMAMDRNILKKLGNTGKVSECKQRKKSSGASKKGRRKSSGGKKGKKSTAGKKSGTKKSAAKKSGTKKSAAKKSGAKKSGGKKSKKSAVNKSKTPVTLPSAV
ncbi:hypothetical protein AVEN_118922-1 [Araneus ventricosus]|uniref:H15 domain-containing protein n=1 Tax=Araneus ventricosus TaxID=182803 RepID=A0A4Y2BXJ1_ARAVE|nr:hypothetical protein AVEN_118922-1 [Araneus ventricosus]